MTRVCGIQLPSKKTSTIIGPTDSRNELLKALPKIIGKSTVTFGSDSLKIERDLKFTFADGGRKKTLTPTAEALKSICLHVGAPFGFISSLPSDVAALVINRLLLSRIATHLVCNISAEEIVAIRPSLYRHESAGSVIGNVECISGYIVKNWPKAMFTADADNIMMYGHDDVLDKNNIRLVLARLPIDGMSSIRTYEGVILGGLDRRPVSLFKHTSMRASSTDDVDDFIRLSLSPKKTGHDLYIDRLVGWHTKEPPQNYRSFVKSSIGIDAGANHKTLGDLIILLCGKEKGTRASVLRQITNGSLIESALSLFKDVGK